MCPRGFATAVGADGMTRVCIAPVGSVNCPMGWNATQPATPSQGVTCALSLRLVTGGCPFQWARLVGRDPRSARNGYRCLAPLGNFRCPAGWLTNTFGSSTQGVVCATPPPATRTTRSPAAPVRQRISRRSLSPSAVQRTLAPNSNACPPGFIATIGQDGQSRRCVAPAGVVNCPTGWNATQPATPLSGVTCALSLRITSTGCPGRWVRLLGRSPRSDPGGYRCRAPVGSFTCPAGWLTNVLGTATQGVICATPPRRRPGRPPGSRTPTTGASATSRPTRGRRGTRTARPTRRVDPRAASWMRCTACPNRWNLRNGRCVGPMGPRTRCIRGMQTASRAVGTVRAIVCACLRSSAPTSRPTRRPTPRPVGLPASRRPSRRSRAPTSRPASQGNNSSSSGSWCPARFIPMPLGGCQGQPGVTTCPRRGDFKMVTAATANAGVVCFPLPACPNSATASGGFVGWTRLSMGRCRAPLGVAACPATWRLSAPASRRSGVTCAPCLGGPCPVVAPACPSRFNPLPSGGCQGQPGVTTCPRRGDFKMVTAATANAGVVCAVLPACPNTAGASGGFVGWTRLSLGRCRAPVGVATTCPATWRMTAPASSIRGVTCAPCLNGPCPVAASAPPTVRPRNTVQPTAARTPARNATRSIRPTPARRNATRTVRPTAARNASRTARPSARATAFVPVSVASARPTARLTSNAWPSSSSGVAGPSRWPSMSVFQGPPGPTPRPSGTVFGGNGNSRSARPTSAQPTARATPRPSTPRPSSFAPTVVPVPTSFSQVVTGMTFASWSTNGGNAAYQSAVLMLLRLSQIPAASVSSVSSVSTLAAPALVLVHGRELQGGNGVVVSTTILTAPGSSGNALSVLGGGGGGGASPIIQAMQAGSSRWGSLRGQAIVVPTSQPSALPTFAPSAASAAGANSNGGSASSTANGAQTTTIVAVVVVVVFILAALGYMMHARMKNSEQHPALSFSEQYMGNQRDSFQGASPAFEPRRSSKSAPQRHSFDNQQQQQQQQQPRNSLRSSVGRPSEGRQSLRLSVEARVPGSQGGPRRPSIAHLAHGSVASQFSPQQQRSPFHGHGREFDEL